MFHPTPDHQHSFPAPLQPSCRECNHCNSLSLLLTTVSSPDISSLKTPSFLFLELANQAPISGPLHLQFLQSGMLFFWTPLWFTSFPLLCKCHLVRKAPSDSLPKHSFHYPTTLSLLTTCYFFLIPPHR